MSLSKILLKNKMDNEVINIERVCRSCLREDGEMRGLFTAEENPRQHEPRLNQKLASSTQIQIRENDGLPNRICVHCAQQLDSAYAFKQMCEISDTKLKKYVSKSSSLKRNCMDGSNSNSGVKQEVSTGSLDIIDFNTMFNSDLRSIKMEVRDVTDPHSGSDSDLKINTSSDFPSSEVNKNEKCTQTLKNDNLHNCPQCQKKFKSFVSLSMHMKRHNSNEIIPCEECGKMYINREQHQKHLESIHNISKETSPDVSTCLICKFPCKKLHHLRKHMMLLHGKNNNYNCVNCDTGYNKYENYQNHVLSCKKKSHFCLICNKSFTTSEALCLHNNEIHKTETAISVPKSNDDVLIKLPENSKPSNNNLANKTNSTVSNVSNCIDEPISVIKEEPLEELLEEAERENQINNDDANSFSDALENNVLDENDEELPSDCSEYQPFQLKKRKGPRGRKRQIDSKRKRKIGKKLKLDTNSEEIGQFPCTLCDKVLTSEINLNVHLAKHTGETFLFGCVACDKTFNNLNRLKRHELSHESLNKFKCNSCDKSFNRQDHLNKHMWSHMDTKPYQCDLCPKGFIKAEQLERHIQALHSGKQKNPKTAFCAICNRGFTTSKYLETHMRMHTGDKTFTCKVCNKSFNSKWHLKEHNKWHSAEKPFLCSECGQRFIRNDYLVIHMRRHKGEKPYKCKFCSKGFPRATDLTVHERYHTGEKTHLCTVCGKGFQRQYNLTVHLRVHTGEKPYICSYCGKRFAQGNDLKSHVRRHTGERFNCDICGEGFIQGYHLTQHKRSLHGIDCTSHIRRVEKHPQANPQNQQNQQVKHRNRKTSNGQQAAQISDNQLEEELAEDGEHSNSLPPPLVPIVPIVPLAIFPNVTRMP